MHNKTFGNLIFNTGWEKKMLIPYNGKEVEIIIHLRAYETDEEPTLEQEISYGDFKNDIESIMSNIVLKLGKEAGKDYFRRYTPVMLVIKRDGDSALLFDDIEDNEGGLAVSFKKEIRIMLQEEFL